MAGRITTPWGWWEVLGESVHWKLKKLHILPGHRTSLQTHQRRGEWWYAIEGEGLYTIGQTTCTTNDLGRWIYIGAGTKHRIEGQPPFGLTILELQLGHGLAPFEVDIARHEDDYGRAT